MADDPNRPEGEGSGCGMVFGWLIVIGAVVAAAMSIAALVDPFSKPPPVADVWADCPPAQDTRRRLFSGPDAPAEYRAAREEFLGAALVVAVLGLIPVVVAAVPSASLTLVH